jgi:hypothetical protein
MRTSGIRLHTKILVSLTVAVFALTLTPQRRIGPDGSAGVSLRLGVSQAQAGTLDIKGIIAAAVPALTKALGEALRGKKLEFAGLSIDLGKLIDTVGTAVGAFMNKDIPRGILAIIKEVPDFLPVKIKGWVQPFVEPLVEVLEAIFASRHEGIKWGDIITSIGRGVVNILKKIDNNIVREIAKYAEPVVDVIEAAFKNPTFAKIAKAVVGALPKVLPAVAKKYVDPFVPALLDIIDAVGDATSATPKPPKWGTLVSKVVDGVASVLPANLKKFADPVANIVREVFASDGKPSIPKVIAAVLTGAKTILKSLNIGQIGGFNLLGLADAAIDVLTQFSGTGGPPNWGKIISGLLNGIKDLLKTDKQPMATIGAVIRPIAGVVSVIVENMIGKDKPDWLKVIPPVIKAISEFLPEKLGDVQLRALVVKVSEIVAKVLPGGGKAIDWKAVVLELVRSLKVVLPSRIGEIRTEPIVDALSPAIEELLKAGTPNWATVLQKTFDGVKEFLPFKFKELMGKLGPIVAKIVEPIAKQQKPDWGSILNFAVETAKTMIYNETAKTVVGSAGSFLAGVLSGGKAEVEKLLPALGAVLAKIKSMIKVPKIQQGIDLICSAAGVPVPGGTTTAEPETKQETKPTEPKAEPTEPKAEPTEPKTEPTEPKTEPTEPKTGEEEPPPDDTKATEETKPSETKTEPTETKAEPTETKTEETKPSGTTTEEAPPEDETPPPEEKKETPAPEEKKETSTSEEAPPPPPVKKQPVKQPPPPKKAPPAKEEDAPPSDEETPAKQDAKEKAPTPSGDDAPPSEQEKPAPTEQPAKTDDAQQEEPSVKEKAPPPPPPKKQPVKQPPPPKKAPPAKQPPPTKAPPPQADKPPSDDAPPSDDSPPAGRKPKKAPPPKDDEESPPSDE